MSDEQTLDPVSLLAIATDALDDDEAHKRDTAKRCLAMALQALLADWSSGQSVLSKEIDNLFACLASKDDPIWKEKKPDGKPLIPFAMGMAARQMATNTLRMKRKAMKHEQDEE